MIRIIVKISLLAFLIFGVSYIAYKEGVAITEKKLCEKMLVEYTVRDDNQNAKKFLLDSVAYINVPMDEIDDMVFSHSPKVIVDMENAVNISYRVAYSIYGSSISKELPLKVSLDSDEVWHICGTLPKGELGGVMYAEIERNGGKIRMLNHGK